MFSYFVILLLIIYTAPRISFDLQKHRAKNNFANQRGLLNGWFWKLVSVFEQEKFVLEFSELCFAFLS